ncbi:acetylcholine receptor subunit beta-type acr-2-like [Octopus sinensis]|uniref:Acetylcholine receptor subunit beta-type acr-2-like n=1 Tax=Octopus sinensis TaxID=2607531 RepID=A0A7E6FGS9_9MOLL|nr:acetylcholine receptor subunit beta-type acr-2-like [Octopus sinensis]
MGLHTLYDLDFVNNLLKARYFFTNHWYDERLVWNPLEHNNITSLYMPKNKVWMPAIIMCNSMKESDDEDKFPEVKIYYNGVVEKWSLTLLHSHCQVNAYAYPFDEHICEIGMCIALHALQHTQIKKLTFYHINHTQNHKWNVNIRGEREVLELSFSYAVASIHLQRKLTIGIIAMLIPTIMMTLLTVFVFLLPPESGEKVSLATTVFLSNVLYLIQFENKTPANSKYPSLLMLYLMLLSLMSGITTLGSVVVSKLYVIQSSNEPKLSSPCKKKNKFCSNQIADVSRISIAKSEEISRNTNRKYNFNYIRLDTIFLKVSIIISIIISIIFISLSFVPQENQEE